MNRNIAIIGGGACGMAAAITAAREGAYVTIYERNDRLGKKILATGNGKCNLGNFSLSADDYHSSDQALIKQCLERFAAEDTVRFFQNMGLMVKDKSGYLYPVSEQASTVLDVLRMTVEQLGITVVYEAKVDRITPLKNGSFEIGWNQKRAIHEKVILACGSKAAPKTGSDGSGYQIAKKLGLKIIPVVPALVQLKCQESYCKAIAGVRADAMIHILGRKVKQESAKISSEKIDCGKMSGERIGYEKIVSECGELQLTEYGISGIPVFQLSGLVNRIMEAGNTQLIAEIDFVPDTTDQEWEEFAQKRISDFNENKSMMMESFFTGMLNKKLMLLFIKLAGLKANTPICSVQKSKLMEVFHLCKHFSLHITGSNSFDNAQICAGGISLKEVTGELEAVKVKGLYLAGEILDVDGRCGGYNLQWAWTSGYIAGKAAVGGGRKAGTVSDRKANVASGQMPTGKKKVVIVRGKTEG